MPCCANNMGAPYQHNVRLQGCIRAGDSHEFLRKVDRVGRLLVTIRALTVAGLAAIYGCHSRIA